MSTRTICVPLKSLLINPRRNLPLIRDLVADVSERVFHLRALLSVLANEVARDDTPDRMRGEIFNQVLVNRAMALCRSYHPAQGNARDRYPPQLLHAAELYFSGPLLYVRDYLVDPVRVQVGLLGRGRRGREERWELRGREEDRRVESDLYGTAIADDMCRQVVTDISNCLIYSTVANQLACLRRKYDLSKAGATAVGRCQIGRAHF